MEIISNVYKVLIAIAVLCMFYWMFSSDKKPIDYYRMNINSRVLEVALAKNSATIRSDQVFLRGKGPSSILGLKINTQDFQVNDSVVKKANSKELFIYRDGKLVKHYRNVIYGWED